MSKPHLTSNTPKQMPKPHLTTRQNKCQIKPHPTTHQNKCQNDTSQHAYTPKQMPKPHFTTFNHRSFCCGHHVVGGYCGGGKRAVFTATDEHRLFCFLPCRQPNTHELQLDDCRYSLLRRLPCCVDFEGSVLLQLRTRGV